MRGHKITALKHSIKRANFLPFFTTCSFGGHHLANGAIDTDEMVCMDIQVTSIKKQCIVNSFSINSQWFFNEAIEECICQVFAFALNPSMRTDSVKTGS